MKLVCAGASSSGNSFALQSNSGQTLFLEAGCHLKDIERQLGYHIDFSHVWLLVSHFHGDHSKYICEFARRGIKCCSNESVRDKYDDIEVTPLNEGSLVKLGEFEVLPFLVEHDVPDYGYLIRHPEMGGLVFFTDAYNVPYKFIGVKHWLVEVNYEDTLLNDNWISGRIDKAQRDRLMLSHFSLENCVNYLHDCHASRSNTIIATHLSSRNADPDHVKAALEREFGVPTYIAKKGLKVELNKTGL